MTVALSFKPCPQVLLFTLFTLETGCIKQFTPKVSQDHNLIAIEGLITDRLAIKYPTEVKRLSLISGKKVNNILLIRSPKI